MAAQKNEPKIVDARNLPVEIPEDGVFDSYANIVNVNWTLDDVRIRFAELIQVPDNESPTINSQHGVLLEKVAVTIPWRGAKHLCKTLHALIASFEKANGEIKDPTLPSL